MSIGEGGPRQVHSGESLVIGTRTTTRPDRGLVYNPATGSVASDARQQQLGSVGLNQITLTDTYRGEVLGQGFHATLAAAAASARADAGIDLADGDRDIEHIIYEVANARGDKRFLVVRVPQDAPTAALREGRDNHAYATLDFGSGWVGQVYADPENWRELEQRGDFSF